MNSYMASMYGRVVLDGRCPVMRGLCGFRDGEPLVGYFREPGASSGTYSTHSKDTITSMRRTRMMTSLSLKGRDLGHAPCNVLSVVKDSPMAKD
jgi:hypothetical protein